MKPTLFIGSSTQALATARAVRQELRRHINVTLWDEGIFSLSEGTLESLIAASRKYDYGLFVFAADDQVTVRNQRLLATRDNVVFELGMFFGALGRDRCFFMLPSNAKRLRLATDLAGVTAALYKMTSKVTQPEVRVGCRQILSTIKVHQTNGLSGTWLQRWTLVRHQVTEQHNSEARLRQMGDHVRARWKAFNRTYEMEGLVQGSLITGRWFDATRAHAYFGAFQLLISPLQESMEGKWVGWSRDGQIRSGKWRWTSTA